ELPPAAQVKLLRAIQEGEVEPVGARKPVKIDVRVISATNRNLMADVQSGRFREDLFYRLHVFPISVPPLRARGEDIPELVRHFLVRFCAEEGKRVRLVRPDALKLLMAHGWPGNVRQLENAIFRAVVLADGDEIGCEEIPQIAAHVSEPPPADPLPAEAPAPLCIDEHAACGLAPAPSDAPLAPGGLTLLDGTGDVRPLEEIEADVIRFALTHYRGQMSEVARRLQIGRSTLYRKLEHLGLAGRAPARCDTDVSAG
ncbi:MAG TPA: sigma 54-interacting transcriptional regulator, partial [Xanthobacteraceae bacterium]